MGTVFGASFYMETTRLVHMVRYGKGDNVGPAFSFNSSSFPYAKPSPFASRLFRVLYAERAMTQLYTVVASSIVKQFSAFQTSTNQLSIASDVVRSPQIRMPEIPN